MSTNQSWGGRFAEGPREAVAAYTDSQTYDRALYAQDIRASQAHARMLGRQGIITPQEAETLVCGLNAVKKEIEDGAFVWKPALEDVHMNIEARLTELVGDTGKKLHTGRSRNDQVGLTFRLFVNDRLVDWQHAAKQLVGTLVRLADGHQADILPGCTHLQPAQPVSLAHHLLAYAWMFARDVDRLDDVRKRVRVSPLGCAALAGTTYPLDPESVAREVGFERIYGNSMDGVSDRDFVLEALFAASCIMAHLSRLCEEIILWANPAFGFVSLSDGYSTGSSIMPQKKNPDVAELMRGKTGRVYGALMGLLTTVKGLPLTYNRDLQEDKEGFLDTDRTVTASLTLMAGMLDETTFRTDRMRAACARGFLNATELADYLVGKGLPFREAHHVTGHAVALAEKEGKGLEDLTLEQLRTLDERIGEDVYAVLDYDAAVRRRETPAGTGPKSVARQLDQLRQWLADRA
ncbi:MAG TPA: argininosuccinate lyase [Candidatus Desulfovibrio gallistercoris]|uniref:argininosuccinate lyase n=1 Tax=uncultured Desulfovibrio sp. TaxID=167968 RepID=UPI001F892CC9|nr:argininosuccinate lyase [uncultured Desulfovibrio sp.]HJA76898.1 argininosuccinate lyase [Candidatus Desulfovibrio gallistercoris]